MSDVDPGQSPTPADMPETRREHPRPYRRRFRQRYPAVGVAGLHVAGCAPGGWTWQRHVLVTTDGSAARRGTAQISLGWGSVASNGRYAAGGWILPKKRAEPGELALLAELAAVLYSTQHLLRAGRHVTVRCDSQSVVDLLGRCVAGDPGRLPAFSTGHDPGARLVAGAAALFVRYRRKVGVEWVRGHDGDPLNEAADSLAAIGRRLAEGVETEATAAARAAVLAAAFMRPPGPAA